MRSLKLVFKGLLLLTGFFIAGGYFIPAQWAESRAIAIHASAEQIYPMVSNFKNWEKWSPWNSHKDASLQYSYWGPEEGVGAKQSWSSEKMGKGWMQFTSATPETGVVYDLHIDMGRSQTQLQGTIAFTPNGDETIVTWTDKGDSGSSFVKRWMSLLIKVMLGKDLEKGLSNLKALVETGK